MKLLLIQPPVEDFYDTDIRLQPIGLCYLKSTIQKYLPDVEVIVKDFHGAFGKYTIPIPQELSYLKDFYAWPDQSPFCTFHHYYHFGASWEKIGQEVAAEKPDMVGISSLFTPYYREVLRTAQEIKRKANIPIIVGGSHVSACPQTILEDPNVDFVILGQGERPMVEFLQAWKKQREWGKVPNLGVKQNGKCFFHPMEENFPIDEIPDPDFSDLSMDSYTLHGRPMAFILASRGCPHHCSFCSTHLTFGKRYLRRSPDLLLAEIRNHYQKGYRVFDFEDDNLTFDQDQMKYLCQKLISSFPQHDVEFLAMNGVSYMSLSGELLELMKKAGFTHLNLSLVTLSPDVCHRMKRPHNIMRYLEVVEKAFQLGFHIVSYQILGLPQESLASMSDTLVFQARLPVLLGASPFYLTPHSPIASLFPPQNSQDMFVARLSAMGIESEHVRHEDIYTLFVTTRILNFLKAIQVHSHSISLSEALATACSQGKRMVIGVKLLQRLLSEKRLYASTKQGEKPLTRFQSDLFFQIWSSLGYIKTQEGKTIIVG